MKIVSSSTSPRDIRVLDDNNNVMEALITDINISIRPDEIIKAEITVLTGLELEIGMLQVVYDVENMDIEQLHELKNRIENTIKERKV